ncbi:hypothetical protein PI124_g3365 [Phytophthora idaei]|nr:hypothetical protein PI126_g2026 [Phytophthora idaei]KAG3252069.1 hypothetical protein PI124_g3365 [Phytophthora idaei]
MARKAVRLVLLTLAFVARATSSESDSPTWVSPENGSDSACCCKTYLSSETCATGYDLDNIVHWIRRRCVEDHTHHA